MWIATALALLMAPQATEPDEAAVGILHTSFGEETALAKPEFRRIADAETWRAFWKSHAPGSRRTPSYAFETVMVLVIPSTLEPGEEKPVDRSMGDVQGWVSDKALRLQVHLKPKAPEKPAKKALQPRTVLNFVVVPRFPQPVEVRLKVGASEETAATLPAAEVTPAPAGIRLQGRLTRTGFGAWMFEEGPKKYDLHLVPTGFKADDPVEIVGRVGVGHACVHMTGTLFLVETIRLAK